MQPAQQAAPMKEQQHAYFQYALGVAEVSIRLG